MKRPAFFSFHYGNDVSRASLVRNIGVVEGNEPLSDNDWEKVKRGGDTAIERWIENQLKYKQIVIVLIGSQTASRPWVLYEISRAYKLGKPLMGIYINGLKNLDGRTSAKGRNPFDYVNGANGIPLSTWVPVHEPWPYDDSKAVYNEIRNSIGQWVESAITLKQNRDILGLR